MCDENSGKARTNYSVGIALALVSALFMYAERIVLVSRMGIVRAGFNSLFENTFLLLSAFDIGVTTYLTNFLLSAVRSGDEEKIAGAVKSADFYCRIACLVMLLLGAAISPLMPLIGKAEEKNLSLLFLLYLLGQSGQYLFGSRVLLLNCFQRNWVVSVYVQAGKILEEIVAIVVIVKTRNYLLYVAVMSLMTFLSYFLISLKTCHDYPYIRKKSGKRISGDMVRHNIAGMTFHRTSFVFYRSLEPFLVSALFGSVAAGLYSNYLIVTSAFLTPFWVYQSTVTPTVTLGYLGGTDEENLFTFRRSVYLNFIMSLLASLVCLAVLTPFIAFSFGPGCLLGSSFDALFAFLVFLSSFRTTAIVFRDAAGIYSEDWKKALFEILAALVLSLVLSFFMGLIGIPAAFVASYILVVLWRENRTVLKSALHEESWDFCAEEAFLMALGLIVIVAVWYVTESMGIVMRLLSSILLWASSVALWLLLFPSARRTVLRRSAR